MNNSIILLAFLLILCIALPYIFNVKYHENFATFPSEKDVALTDVSNVDVSSIDVSFSEVIGFENAFSEPMTNSSDKKDVSVDELVSILSDNPDPSLNRVDASSNDNFTNYSPSLNEHMSNFSNNNSKVNSYNEDIFSNYEKFLKNGYAISDYFIKNPSSSYDLINKFDSDSDISGVSFLNNMR